MNAALAPSTKPTTFWASFFNPSGPHTPLDTSTPLGLATPMASAGRQAGGSDGEVLAVAEGPHRALITPSKGLASSCLYTTVSSRPFSSGCTGRMWHFFHPQSRSHPGAPATLCGPSPPASSHPAEQCSAGGCSASQSKLSPLPPFRPSSKIQSRGLCTRRAGGVVADELGL